MPLAWSQAAIEKVMETLLWNFGFSNLGCDTSSVKRQTSNVKRRSFVVDNNA
jgi:hypothetical protein